MSWRNWLFGKRVEVKTMGNDNITAIELDGSKRYILVIKEGYVNIDDLTRISCIDPKRISIVRTR